MADWRPSGWTLRVGEPRRGMGPGVVYSPRKTTTSEREARRLDALAKAIGGFGPVASLSAKQARTGRRVLCG